MDLKEAINYRELCLICEKRPPSSVVGHSNLNIDWDKKAMYIKNRRTKKIMMSFGFDGTYRQEKKNDKSYSQSIQIEAACSSCRCKPDSISMPKLSPHAPAYTQYLFHSTLENLKTSGCIFTFDLYIDHIRGSYEVRPQMDVVRFYDDNIFHHWTTDFQKNTTILQSAKFTETLENLLSLRLPAASLATVKNKEDFLRKYKLFTLFS